MAFKCADIQIFPIGKFNRHLWLIPVRYSRSGKQGMNIEEIGIIIRQARLAQGLRQDQLAAAAGVGLRFLVELERGKPTVRLAKVLAVLNALGCRLDVTPPSSLRSDA